MITNSNDYNELLWLILTNAPTKRATLLPKTEQIYNVDLNTKKVEVPKFLSVKNDHLAETVYFKIDRYYEHMDLTNTSCIIKYTNAAKESFIYPVPYYDLDNAINENKIIIPWCILGQATKYSGTIKFSICFYKVNEYHKISYTLNTLVAESEILLGQNEEDFNLSNDSITLDSDMLELVQELERTSNKGMLAVYWLDV